MRALRKSTRVPLLVVLVLAALVLPVLFRRSQYNLILLTTVVLYGILTTAWNLIGGMAGQLDLAAGAYLGLGAFTAGTLLIRWTLTPWAGTILGGLVATEIGRASCRERV